MIALLLLHMAFALGIAGACACRLHHCTSDVKWEVRWGISAVGASAIALAVGPFVGWMGLSMVQVLAEGALFVYFVASSQAWVYGIPPGLSNRPMFDRRSGQERRTFPP